MSKEDNYILVLKRSKKGYNPEHLKPYQKKFSQAAKECSEKTKHLKGAKRVTRFNDCIRQKTKKWQKNKNLKQ